MILGLHQEAILKQEFFLSDLRISPAGFIFEAIPVTFVEDFSIKKWVYCKAIVKSFSDTTMTMLIRGYNAGADNNLKFYLDDISMKKITLRP